jgi:hypothetical protein
MAEYIEVEEAIGRPGLRVVVGQGRPGPWNEAVKGILYVKKTPFVRVRQEDAPSPNLALLKWTGQTSAPVLVYNDERPRSIWIDQLFLAERLAPNPPLIPARIEDRVLMFGLSNELCGENGFGWSRRMMLMHASITNAASAAAKSAATIFGNKYGYAPQAAAAAPARVAEILKALGQQLEAQRRRGSRFFIRVRNPVPDSLSRKNAGSTPIYQGSLPGFPFQAPPNTLPARPGTLMGRGKGSSNPAHFYFLTSMLTEPRLSTTSTAPVLVVRRT